MKIDHEFELLLACAAAPRSHECATSGQARARILRLLNESIDAESFVALAERQGLLPLAYRRLRDLAESSPARELSDLMREKYARNAARCLFLTRELCNIIGEFERAGIDPIPYKGPALAVAAYGDPALRQFVDLDILVRPRDVMRATELLTSSGYKPHFKLRSAREHETFLRLSYVQLFTRDGDDLAVELHWNVAPRFFNFKLDVESLWDSEERIALGGRDVRAIANETLVLLLCVHGNKDFWLRLEWLAAINALASRSAFDWARLLDEAKRRRALRVLLLGLRLAQELLGTSLPEEVRRLIAATPSTEPLAEAAKRMMFDEEARVPSLAGQVRFHTRSKDRLRDRLAYCSRLALTTTPVDWAALDLPARLAFAHAFVRPFRLARKYLFAPTRRAS